MLDLDHHRARHVLRLRQRVRSRRENRRVRYLVLGEQPHEFGDGFVAR
jgi:hypothetical protein